MTHRRPSQSALLPGLALLFAWTVYACVASGPARVESTPGGSVAIVRGVQLGWAKKIVATMQPPETLVARDGTVCRVAPDRYADTAAGDLVSCEWQPGAPPADSLGPPSPRQAHGDARRQSSR